MRTKTEAVKTSNPPDNPDSYQDGINAAGKKNKHLEKKNAEASKVYKTK